MERIPNGRYTQEFREEAVKNPALKKIYHDYEKFRADQNLLFRFADAGYDDFMQSQKL